MNPDTLKVVIPMAGMGTRLRPFTLTKPKQLVPLAGKAMLAHVLDMLDDLPDPDQVELIFIIGYRGEQVKDYMQANYPHRQVHYYEQKVLQGQSHAIYMAREHLVGPMLMVFADTLVKTDLKALLAADADAVVCVKEVPDPRRFGATILDPDGLVTRLIEKPTRLEDNLAMVGFYYFKHAEDLISAIEVQMERETQYKGEFYLADAVNIMLESGLAMRTQQVEVWLDAGTPEAVLETNGYLLDHGQDNTAEAVQREGIVVIPPVFIHPEAEVSQSVIGPHVAIGAGCQVRDSVIRESILDESGQVQDIVLEKSILGFQARVNGHACIINLGDGSTLSV